MKSIILSALAITTIIFACNNPTKNTVAANNAQTQNSDTVNTETVYQIDTLKSTLGWEGAEGLLNIVKTHNGLLSLNNGSLQTKNDSLVGGSFTIPLKTLTVLDIPKEKPGNRKLVKHLLAYDFFDVEKFPNASFEITNVKSIAQDSSLITGNLTLKGVSKSISFKAKITLTDSVLKASAPKFYFNRKDWGMIYGTKKSLGNELIRPEIGIEISLVATRK